MELISMNVCKKKLAILWFVSYLFIFLIIFVQTIYGRYDDQFSDVWTWLNQNTLPTLSLIISIFVVDVLEYPSVDKIVDDFYYKFCFWGCFIYLTILLLTIAFEYIATCHIETRINGIVYQGKMSPLEYLKKSNSWLSPIQALVSVLLGVFFIKKSQVAP